MVKAEALLHDVRVVEIAHPLTEHAGRLFASLGAEVLLVETPAGSVTRARHPHLPDSPDPSRSSVPFLARNANKHSIVLDPAVAGDVARLHALIERSNLVLDADSSPYHAVIADSAGDASRITVTDELGLGTASIVGFAASGGMACSGWPNKAPANAPSWLAADAASIYAASMGATALFVQQRHGVRLDYEIPYNEAAIRCIAPWSRHLHAAGVNVAGQGVNPGRSGAGPYPVIQTADGWIKLVIATPRQIEALLELMGRPEELTTGIWADDQFRKENIVTFFLACEEYLQDRTSAELFHAGQALGLTITPLNTIRQFRADPHAQERGLFVTVDDPDHGPMELLRAPTRSEPQHLLPTISPAPSLNGSFDQLATIEAEPPFALTPTGTAVDPLRPLADLRLLQLGSGAVVPEACSDFALLGADIVRVESMVNQDFLRRGGLGGDPNCSPSYNQLNLGVRSLAIDMTQGDATTIVQRLVDQCDAVVENMRAPVVENWGFDYDACRQVRDDVICLSSQGFGHGPYGRYQSFGPNLSAYAGVASQWAHPDDPVRLGASIPHPDHVAGKQAYVALLAALRRRDLDGNGCFIEAAQVEAPAYLIADRYVAQSLSEDDLAPAGNTSQDHAPFGCYPCSDDEWVALATETDAQWLALADLVGEEWALDIKLTDPDVRRFQSAVLDVALGEWTRGWQVDKLEEALRAAGVPASRVVNSDHMAAGDGNEPGGIFAEVDHPSAGRLAYTGLPVLTPDGQRPVALPAPCIGEHTDDIVHQLAGCDRQRIIDLREQKVLGH